MYLTLSCIAMYLLALFHLNIFMVLISCIKVLDLVLMIPIMLYELHCGVTPVLARLLFRWLDGNFSDLSSDAIEAESDEYMKEIYKIQKSFNIRLKKLLAERDEKMRERAKKKRRKTEIQELLEGPEAAAAVKEDEEPDIVTPAAITVCTQVQEEIQQFKVSGNKRRLREILGEVDGRTDRWTGHRWEME